MYIHGIFTVILIAIICNYNYLYIYIYIYNIIYIYNCTYIIYTIHKYISDSNQVYAPLPSAPSCPSPYSSHPRARTTRSRPGAPRAANRPRGHP